MRKGLQRLRSSGLLLGLWVFLAACSGSHFEAPEVHGPPAMVSDDGRPRLWVLSKQEEVRQTGVGGGGRNSSMSWRSDTFFHFEIRAFDPVTARPLWQQRLVTFSDEEARGPGPSRVIGSSSSGRLLGQDGKVVWLLIDHLPMAVNVADGKLIADPAGIEQRNPDLVGLLPSESRHYGFDRGLVFLSADARQFVIRGPDLKAQAYVPPPPPPPEQPAPGRLIVPMRPALGEIPTRQVRLGGEWLGLYSEKEAADAGNDEFGDRLRYPYTILDEGQLSRRGFWRARIATVQRFDERYERLADLAPIPHAPIFLRGRFLKKLPTDDALVLESPPGVLVWHSTRIDSAGRLALTRISTELRKVWTAELPLSENSITTPAMYWQLPDRIVVMGQLQVVDDGVHSREPHLVSIRLSDGSQQAWNLPREKAVP